MSNNIARALKVCGAFVGCAVIAAGLASAAADSSNGSPIYGVTVPPGYRDWKLISINHLQTSKVNQLRAQLGNDIAIKAFKDGTLPFPDGSIIVAIHWEYTPSEDNNKVLAPAFPGAQSNVAGKPVNLQVMVKDSKKYAASGGWGYGDFRNGKPGDQALHAACFPCHVPAKDHDYIFAHYAGSP